MDDILGSIPEAAPEAPSDDLSRLSDHERAMVEKFDDQVSGTESAKPAPVPDGKQRPEGVPEKFWDAEKGEVRTEALLKSYSELEKGRSTKDVLDGETKPSEVPTPAPAPAEGSNPVESARAEYAKDGKLSDATFEALSKVGISKDVVNSYIQNQIVAQEAHVSSLKNHAGGAEQYQSMVTWAGQSGNMSEEQIGTFNRLIGGTKEQAMMAIDALKSRYHSAVGKAPNLLKGSASVPSSQGYASQAEMIADMSDPRYKVDRAFRARVEAKLSASPDNLR